MRERLERVDVEQLSLQNRVLAEAVDELKFNDALPELLASQIISRRFRADDAVRDVLTSPVRGVRYETEKTERSTVASIDEVWPSVRALAGEEFRQKGGKPFTYLAHDNYLKLETTNRNISRTALATALERVPLSGPADVQDLTAPSYIYGILMDTRVSQQAW